MYITRSMYILHDSPSADLSHVQAIASIDEGFGLFDYVRITQNRIGHNDSSNAMWIAQIVQPNQNISVVGNRLDPTILHGLELMQQYDDVQSVRSVQVFDLLILGEYDGRQLLTPRLRPLPGAVVMPLSSEEVAQVIGVPLLQRHSDESTNVIGILTNARDVPLGVTSQLFNYHFMVAGGTGSGKSNAAANLVLQATKLQKCVLIHDAKPDYGLINRANTDPRVTSVWSQFEQYGLSPHGAEDIVKVGFFQRCNPEVVDHVVGFYASDFSPEMLASLFFTAQDSPLQFENFAAAISAVRERAFTNGTRQYTLDDIVNEVTRRMDQVRAGPDLINEANGQAILRKVRTRRNSMPWLDVVGTSVQGSAGGRIGSSRLDRQRGRVVEAFEINRWVNQGRILVIDYRQLDEQDYALILSYFLRECQKYRKDRGAVGIVQLVDEAHRIFDNESKHGGGLTRAFERAMREGRSVDHSIILSLQNASQIPARVMNNLNSKVVMRQNSKAEADAATQTMGKEFSIQAMRLGTGSALISLYESRATVLAQMAPSPFELMRTDNTTS
jgi:DNA helicase HerA-like ATPase